MYKHVFKKTVQKKIDPTYRSKSTTRCNTTQFYKFLNRF